jgi:hypothetical protein
VKHAYFGITASHVAKSAKTDRSRSLFTRDFQFIGCLDHCRTVHA